MTVTRASFRGIIELAVRHMDDLTDRIRSLVESGTVRVSEHGYDQLAEDDLTAREIIEGAVAGIRVEQYPDYPKGPCVLMLQRDARGAPVHVLWGIPRGHRSPAVLVTAYRPDPDRWEETFQRRNP